MHIPVLLSAIGASALAFAAHAQNMPAPPTADQPMTQQEPGAPPPVDNGTSTMPAPSAMPGPGAATPPPPPPAAYNAVPSGAPSGPVQMSPSSPVVQAAPQPPAEYPVCSKTVTDACRNRGGQ